MEWTYEVALTSATKAPAELQAWFASGPRAALARLAGFDHVDVYTPAEGDNADPYNQDVGGPAMVLMISFRTRDALAAALADGSLAEAIGEVPAGVAATGAALERRLYPVVGAGAPARLEAPFSYVVRYHRPAEDEATFVDLYLATHPSTQANLPGIRAVLCYLPVDDAGGAGPLPDPDYMVGNEVAFDDMDAFNRAMASPVREQLREHYRHFPKFSGVNTHYPMERKRHFG